MSASPPVRRPPASAPLPDLTKLTRSELIHLRVELGRDIDAIRAQLENARTRVRLEGVFASRAWYASAVIAQRAKGRQLSAVEARLAELKELARAPRPDDAFTLLFYELAGEMLAPEEFDRIHARASALVREKPRS